MSGITRREGPHDSGRCGAANGAEGAACARRGQDRLSRASDDVPALQVGPWSGVESDARSTDAKRGRICASNERSRADSKAQTSAAGRAPNAKAATIMVAQVARRARRRGSGTERCRERRDQYRECPEWTRRGGRDVDADRQSEEGSYALNARLNAAHWARSAVSSSAQFFPARGSARPVPHRERTIDAIGHVEQRRRAATTEPDYQHGSCGRTTYWMSNLWPASSAWTSLRPSGKSTRKCSIPAAMAASASCSYA